MELSLLHQGSLRSRLAVLSCERRPPSTWGSWPGDAGHARGEPPPRSGLGREKRFSRRRTVKRTSMKHPHQDQQTRAAQRSRDRSETEGPRTRGGAGRPPPRCLHASVTGCAAPTVRRHHSAAKNPAPCHGVQGIAAQQVTDALCYREGRITAAVPRGLPRYRGRGPVAGAVGSATLARASKIMAPHRALTGRSTSLPDPRASVRGHDHSRQSSSRPKSLRRPSGRLDLPSSQAGGDRPGQFHSVLEFRLVPAMSISRPRPSPRLTRDTSALAHPLVRPREDEARGCGRPTGQRNACGPTLRI